MASSSYPVALYLQDAHPIREGIEFVRQAEAAGFSAVWQADSRLVRDAVVPMAAFAATTDRIKIGSGVIDIWTRNAARLASTFSTLDDLAPGRILCGLGAWWDPLASKVGIERAEEPQDETSMVGSTHFMTLPASAATRPYSAAVFPQICHGPSISLPRHQNFTACGSL